MRNGQQIQLLSIQGKNMNIKNSQQNIKSKIKKEVQKKMYLQVKSQGSLLKKLDT
jgi:hypothetical protein